MQTPTIHFKMASWLQRCVVHGERRLLLQAFRASGKSTIAALFLAWMLCRDPALRILVLAAESSLSEKMVRTIRKIIRVHPLTKHLVPHRPEEWAADRFTVQRDVISRDPSVLARGLYANITGVRADVIVCDDVEVPNSCDSAEKRAALRERLGENEFILTPGGMQLYLGTPHSYYSLYADTPRREIGEAEIFLKDYNRLSIPLLDANGKSAWPERYGAKEIARLRRQSGPAKFESQMMLRPVNSAQGFLNPALLRRYDDALQVQEIQRKIYLSLAGRRLVSASAWWDPAFGREGGGGDASVVAVIFADEAGGYYLHRVEYIRVRPQEGEDEAGLQCRVAADLAAELYLPSIAVETNGIGKFLPAILRKELARRRLPCSVIEKSSHVAKDQRILESFDAVMAARALYVHESVYQTPFIREMQEWRPGLSARRGDDGLDAAAGALSCEPVRIRSHYGPLSRATPKPSWKPHGTQKARSDFEV